MLLLLAVCRLAGHEWIETLLLLWLLLLLLLLLLDLRGELGES